MSARAHPAGFTYEDYLLFPEDGRRHELISGAHVATPALTLTHQKVLVRLIDLVAGYIDVHHLGVAVLGPFEVVLSDSDVVQPDLLFVASAHLDRLGERGLRGAPDLAVEITSEASRRTDEVVKRKLYEAHGVEEYWVVDPEIETVKVYRRSGDAFAHAAETSREAGDSLTTPLLPGLTLPLARIFA